MQCIFTRQAENDLESIADYIALDNPVRAYSFVEEIQKHCEEIINMPKGYPLVPEYGQGVRRVVHGNYLILYIITDDNIVILHITHASKQTLSLH